MILSKPLSTTRLLIFQKSSRFMTRSKCTVNFFTISNQNYRTNNSNYDNIFVPIHNNNNNNNSSLIKITKRNFKTPPNSYLNHKHGYMAGSLEKCLIAFALIVFSTMMIDYRYIWFEIVPAKIREPILEKKKIFLEWTRKNLKKADSLAKNSDNDEQPEQSTFNDNKKSSKLIDGFMAVFKFQPKETDTEGFRNKRIIEYENRIRLYSNPDKIFRYFSTIKIIYPTKETEIFMTPDDFLRALTPGIKQPDGLGLDQFIIIDLTNSNEYGDQPFEMTPMLFQQLSSIRKQDYKNDNLNSDSLFYKLSKNGLINFPDFLFLLNVISVSPRNFEIAFRMFDWNGDGQVEFEEFAKVQNAILNQTSVGKKMGKVQLRYKGFSSAISRYFFGDDLKKCLNISEFLKFQDTLQKELLTLEFKRKHPNPNTGKIHELDFADLLVAYALLSDKKKQRMNKRVMNKFFENNSIGITLEDFLNFYRFLQCINDVDIALGIYNIAGASIDQATLKHAAKTVAQVELTDHLVDVVFTIFDDDEDGQLSHKEFIAIMKERLRRGLSKPKDTGFLAIMYTIWKSLISFDF